MLMYEGLTPRNIDLQYLYDKFGDTGHRFRGDQELWRMVRESEPGGGSEQFWLQRPINRQMINTIANDVLVLLPPVHDRMSFEMSSRGIPAADMEKLSDAYITGKVRKTANPDAGHPPKAKQRPIIKLTERQKTLLACSRPGSAD